ncbi:MAG: hypothetical protein A3E36_02115 [Candidatus Andersenbacteria bacterium RIFCSPHIGHO2_12_FULL_45_11b]|uniref:Glycosyltransferase RgtA/B/C/D-like domain-containing protein n=1 Tax=Candidatus Andersenbacteria bacterium RIFCSPHIGHO2_12_FULL_45_11b TaxID=1797282 RepID=A0A1G1XBD5_9BACT|nr:MAG: hypothetical protein A3E36_02115 [Candidatus Andersenbacteria bacterium RIFCSPHIGHO2_12_FULL_45_11b]
MTVTRLIFLVSIAIQLLYVKITGVKMGGDSDFYIQGASILTNSHFSFIQLFYTGYPLYYLAYPASLALLQNNTLLVVWVQIILHAFAGVLIYKIASRIHSKTAGIISGFAYAFSFELFQWNTYILTDSLFIFLVVAALYLYTKKSWYIFIGIICGMTLLRPTAAPFLLAAAVASTWHFKKIYKILAYTMLLLTVTYSVAHILSIDAGTRLGISGYIHYFASLFERGVLVRDRASLIIPVTWSSSLSLVNIYTFIKILFLRFLLFWAPAISDFSLPHTLINIITLIPLYIFAIFGISKYAKRHILGITVIIIFWIFQSFTELDYDWRYRTPVLPALIIFAGMGAADYLQTGRTLIKNIREVQIIRFLFFGLVTAAADYLILNILHLVFDISIFWSVFWGFISGGLIGYFLHSRFTFRYNAGNKDLIKLSHYLLLCGANLALTEIVVQSLTVQIGVPYNTSKLIALVLVAGTSFIGNKFIVFRKSSISAIE